MPSTPTSRRASIRNRIRYHFDNLLSRGTWAALFFLAVVTLTGVLFASALLAVFSTTFSGSEEVSWGEDAWQSLLRVMDPGTMAGDAGWATRLLALVVTIFGIVIAGTLIGLVATGIEQRVDELRRGRSLVVESGHLVILGASSRLPVVIEQLALANRSRRRNAIVVLANREPDQMWDDVRAYADSLYSTHLIFRWGDPTRTTDLDIVNVQAARAVIVLVDDDAAAVKAVLAAGSVSGFDRVPIVVDLGDAQTAEGLARACGGLVVPLVAAQSISRIMAFALHEPGLSQVLVELLDFRGSDIHVHPVGDLAGWRFDEIVLSVDNARPIGRLLPDGTVEINPDADTKLAAHDRLIVIATDDRALTHPTSAPTERLELVSPAVTVDGGLSREKLLVVGWNGLGSQLLTTLNDRIDDTSSIEIIYDHTMVEPEELPQSMSGGPEITLTPWTSGSGSLAPVMTDADFTTVVLLGYRRLTSEEADSRTLLNLMVLKQEIESHDGVPPRLIVELLDADSIDLARVTGADDYVVSDAVTSRLMAQVAEQPERRPVLRSIYEADGPTLHLVPAEDLGLAGEVSFEEIVAAAYTSRLLALGWRDADDLGGTVRLNPEPTELIRLAPGDQIVIIG